MVVVGISGCARRRTDVKTDQDQLRGVFLHAIFPLPGWGGGEMGFAGWKGFIDWAKALDYNACCVHLFPRVRVSDPDWTLAEARRLYHGLLRPRPEFQGGQIYYEPDPLMCTERVKRQQDTRQQALRYAASVGLEPYVWLLVSIGAPTFTDEHPELLASHPGDFCQEGFVLSTKYPEALEHLHSLWGHVVDSYPEAAGFILWHGDPGVGDAEEITENPERFAAFIMSYYDLIRARRPDAKIILPGWGIPDDIVPTLAKLLPNDIIITEPPLIHSINRSPEQHLRRIRYWHSAGFRVQQWLEIQENPTIWLPQVYPKRIERAMRLAGSEGVDDFWSSSSFYSYVFSPHFHVVSQLARDKEKTAEQVTRDYLSAALGDAAVDDAMAWSEAMEALWTKFHTPSQTAAGFNWPWHIVFAGGLLPQKLMREPIPDDLVDEIEASVDAANVALEAARKMAKHTWVFHPLDTNILLISTELLLQRAEFRRAKLPVLEAIRTGNLSSAVSAFNEMTRLARLMVETAASAPNTQMLNTHWAKLSLLPDKLNAVKHHLPELVEHKRIREVFTL